MRLMIAGILLLAAQVSTQKCGDTASSPTSPTAGAAAGGGAAAAANVLPIAVTAGPTNNALNQPFGTVTICVPGTSNCQVIGGILIDTGSMGLRILSSAVTIPLPQQTGAGGGPVVECHGFVDGFTWGPVQTADIKMAGEQASAASIQLIGVDRFPTIPSSCSSQGSSEETQGDLGANGILGVGPAKQDCGSGCTFAGSSNPGLYYLCPTPSTCQVTTVPAGNQVANPVALFAGDNNGVALQLPIVQAGGAPSVSGSLIFGIGTQSNNALGAAKVFGMDARGNFTTTFNGQSYAKSFIDSGSNGIFFLDAATSGLPDCKNSTGFYCPTATRTFSATHVGANGTSATVSFSAGNVDTVNATFSVFGEATGSNPGGFDWGLPFFYGRTIFTAIVGQPTPAGPGPYWAY
jgi:hypothetical protein